MIIIHLHNLLWISILFILTVERISDHTQTYLFITIDLCNDFFEGNVTSKNREAISKEYLDIILVKL